MHRQTFMPLYVAQEWRRLTVEALAALIVSDERRDWILERYPPTDMGRPGLIHNTPRGEKHTAVRETDTDAPGLVPATECVTLEFDGNEDALELVAD
jgi:hypothetical protein